MGLNGVTALSNGNYVVGSPAWNGNKGAATWVSGTSGATLDGQNTIDAQNSIEGAAASASPNPILIGDGAFAGSFFAAVPAARRTCHHRSA